VADLFNLSVCSGAGMLDLSLELAFGIRTVAYVEREAFAAACLLARMEESSLEPAPIWCGDIEAFHFGKWHGAVDSISSGFPCQPWSYAGQRKGTEDDRWIWPAIARGVRLSGAWLVALENVPGILSPEGIGRVLGDLGAMGFDAEWCVLSAAACGAAHRRKRVFILAVHAKRRRRMLRESSGGDGFARSYGAALANAERSGSQGGELHAGLGGSGESAPEFERSGAALANAERSGSQGEELRAGPGQSDAGRGIETLADAETFGSERRFTSEDRKRERPGAASRSGIEIFAPGPHAAEWGDILERAPWLAPAVPNGCTASTESGFCGVADGLAVVVDAARADQLRAIGNGVVPLQAAFAFRILARRLGVLS
jgi:DNA (cytosine-5)-methyltransferase 1